MLDMNPIYDQLKRIADCLELIARKELALAPVQDAPKAPGLAPSATVAQSQLFDPPSEVQESESPVKTIGRGRPKKTAAPLAEAVAKAELNQDLQVQAQVPPKHTEADVREHLMRYVQRNTKEEALALLRKYKAMKIKDLQPQDYDPIIADMQTDEELHHGKAKK